MELVRDQPEMKIILACAKAWRSNNDFLGSKIFEIDKKRVKWLMLAQGQKYVFVETMFKGVHKCIFVHPVVLCLWLHDNAVDNLLCVSKWNTLFLYRNIFLNILIAHFYCMLYVNNTSSFKLVSIFDKIRSL